MTLLRSAQLGACLGAPRSDRDGRGEDEHPDSGKPNDRALQAWVHRNQSRKTGTPDRAFSVTKDTRKSVR